MSKRDALRSNFAIIFSTANGMTMSFNAGTLFCTGENIVGKLVGMMKVT